MCVCVSPNVHSAAEKPLALVIGYSCDWERGYPRIARLVVQSQPPAAFKSSGQGTGMCVCPSGAEAPDGPCREAPAASV